MCWNPEVSLFTFLFSTCLASYAYSKKKISFIILLFFYSFSLIQLVEFFLWLNLDKPKFTSKTCKLGLLYRLSAYKEPNINYLFSCIGFFIILSQPFISLLRLKDEKLKKNMILLYLIFCIYGIYFYPTEMKTIVGQNKHLEWKWLKYPLHIILIWFLFFTFYDIYENKILSFIIIFIPFLISLITYKMTNTWGSMWCWFSNIYSLLLLL